MRYAIKEKIYVTETILTNVLFVEFENDTFYIMTKGNSIYKYKLSDVEYIRKTI